MPDSTAAIRSWAQNNGHHVAERGRLSVEVREAYAKAQKSKRATKAPAPTKTATAKPRSVTPKPAAAKAKAATTAPRPTPIVAPIGAVAEPVAEKSAADPLAVRVAALEQQLKDLSARLATVESKKRVFGRRSA
jgi:hypothetical protein